MDFVRGAARTTPSKRRNNTVREGQDWVVDLDIAQFFDHVHHDILMRRIAEVIRDKKVLRLIGRLADGSRPNAHLRITPGPS